MRHLDTDMTRHQRLKKWSIMPVLVHVTYSKLGSFPTDAVVTETAVGDALQPRVRAGHTWCPPEHKAVESWRGLLPATPATQ